MIKKSCQQKVKSVYPDAIIVEDIACGKNIYKSEWAETTKYAIGLFRKNKPTDIGKVWKCSYATVINSSDWKFLSGWRETKLRAWKDAWKSIELEMLQKLEQ